MIKNSKIWLLAMALGVSSTIVAQTTQKLTAAKHNEYGLIYSLPKTHLRIEVEAELTVKKRGEYYNYAPKYIGTNDVITEDSQSWTLKGVRVYSYGVPEKGKEYLMQFKAGSTPYMIVDKNGMPLSINTESYIVETFTPKEGTELTASVLDNNTYATALSGELLASGSLAKRAETAANTIYKIRESRTNYAIGEADQMPADGQSLKLILDELQRQETALMAMFVGTTQTATAVRTFDYTPTDKEGETVLLRISDVNGISAPDDLSGEPLYLNIKIEERGKLPLDEKGLERVLPKGAVMYNIPGKARVTLTYENEEWYNELFDVAQYGVEYGINPALFTDKKSPSYVKFHPTTGGIVEIGVTTPSTPSKK